MSDIYEIEGDLDTLSREELIALVRALRPYIQTLVNLVSSAGLRPPLPPPQAQRVLADPEEIAADALAAAIRADRARRRPRRLKKERRLRNRRPPLLDIDQILEWADEHFARTGQWPTADSGVIYGQFPDTWRSVDNGLRHGLRGLTAGSSLARLLDEYRGVRNRKNAPKLTEEQILAWADAHYARTGQWPQSDSGPIPESPQDTWCAVSIALARGLRGLPGGTTLARLLSERRGRRSRSGLPPYTEEQILVWADAYFARHGKWPTVHSGAIEEAPGETWHAVQSALCNGTRGLQGGSSLLKFLVEKRGAFHRLNQTQLSYEQILSWADAHRERTGAWPNANSGAVEGVPGERWDRIDNALRQGSRGLPGGSSLTQLLAQYRDNYKRMCNRPLTEAQILAWADAHYRRTGEWPTRHSGLVVDAPGEHWGSIQAALLKGYRGLPGGSTLARLLAAHRGARHKQELPPYTIEQILAWADAFYARHNQWPTVHSGEIPEAAGETWQAVQSALCNGKRGLQGGSSLARLLAAERGVKNVQGQPSLTYEQILVWADAHRERTGAWPNANSGAVEGVPGERWDRIDNALRDGRRGLPGGSSLARLLAERRGKTKRSIGPPLTEEQILAWAEAHYKRTGKWPTCKSGPVEEANGETWASLHMALYQGHRGLTGGSSLSRLLDTRRLR